MGRSPRRLVAVLDVFHPGLAGGHLLVCRCQRNVSGPRVELSLGSIAVRARMFEIVDGHVEPLDRSGMHVAAPNGPARQCHRESNRVQPKSRRYYPPDARIASVTVQLAALSRCSLDCLAARHGAQHLPSPLWETRERKRERDPPGESAAGPAGLDHLPQAPRLGAIRASVAFGLRAEVLPAGPARYQVTSSTRPFR
jgi:hypothetical protein